MKKETCPDGSPDQNVFDIRQGVTIAFFIKNKTGQKADAVVRHADLWGQREAKYDWLNENDLAGTPWQDLTVAAPFYQFLPGDETLRSVYQSFSSVQAIFPVNSVGIVTARDDLTINMVGGRGLEKGNCIFTHGAGTCPPGL